MDKSHVALALLMMCLSWIGGMKAQSNFKMKEYIETISVLTRYEVKEGYQKDFGTALRKYVKAANAKKTNIMAEGYYEQEHPSILWLIERWSTKDALDEMMEGTEFHQLTLLSETNLTQPAKSIYVKDLEPLSGKEWRRRPEKEDRPITIMLFVDSKPGTEDKFKDVYHRAMPQFRSEPGVINYQLSQLEDDSTLFVTYEKFRNEEAFQYHLTFPPIQPVIDYLNTSIKQQPFQTGLHRLVALAEIKNS